MTGLDGVFKSRDNTFPANVCLVRAMVFPVVMYGCESWTVDKTEHRKKKKKKDCSKLELVERKIVCGM